MDGTAHAVLTDLDELRALAADLDRQAADRLDGLVAAGELPRDWPAPYDALGTLEVLATRAGEVLDEQAGADGGYTAAPPIPGRADRAGTWLTELAVDRAGARQHRPGQPGGRAARRGGPPDDAGRRAPRGTGARARWRWSTVP